MSADFPVRIVLLMLVPRRQERGLCPASGSADEGQPPTPVGQSLHEVRSLDHRGRWKRCCQLRPQQSDVFAWGGARRLGVQHTLRNVQLGY